MKLRFKRFAAITMVLIFFFSLTAPAFAEGLSGDQSAAGSTACFYEETGALQDSGQMAGEAIVCVSDYGAALLQVRLADTDIVLTNMMDVTDGVQNLDSAECSTIFGAGIVPENCRLMAAQSPSIDTESLIALLESCDGVYFAEANTVTVLNDITPEETAEDSAEDELSDPSTDEEILTQDTTEEPDEAVQEQTEETAAELSANEDTDAPVQNIDINIPETDGTSKSDMTVMQWALENLGKVFNGKAGVDVNLQCKKTANKTVICVMDSGIDYTHEDLQYRMLDLSDAAYTNGAGKQIMDDAATGCGRCGYNATDSTKKDDPMDYNGHGTHCAGIIAGEGNTVSGTAGIMDNAALVAVKVSSGSNVRNLDVLEGINWVLRAKTEFGVNIAAVNFSIGIKKASSVFKLALAELDQADVTFCIGAGNDNSDHDLNEFFGYNKADSSLVVDAVNANGTKASYSDYGLRTDLFGTGSMIYSTVTEYENKTEHTEKSALHFDGAAYGEAGMTHAYAGFDNNGKDTLTFHEVTSGTTSHAAVTKAYYKSGGQSLMLSKGTIGSVVLESDAVNLTDNQHGNYKAGDPLYFDMGAFTVDNDLVDYRNFYTLVSVEVTYTSGEKQGQTGYETYAVHYDVSDETYCWYDYMIDFDSFENNRSSLGRDNQASFTEIIQNSSDAKPLSEWITAHQKEWTVDYSHFRICLETCSAKNIQSNGSINSNAKFEYNVCLDSIALGSQAGYYDYMSGTSMATPSVTGVYGLVYSHYGKENATDTQYECNDKISARIAGSVTTTFADGASMGLDQYCITGGVVNASAALSTAEANFNPVIQSASVSGDVLTLKGWFLGKEGSITIGGKPAKILSWDQDKNEAIDDADNAGSITVQIPENITGEQIIKVTNAKGKTGRFYTDCSHITTDYEDLALPGGFSQDAETNYTTNQQMAVINHELYLYGLRTDYKQILDVYDIETGSWQSVPFVDSTVPADKIYGFVSAGEQLYGLFPLANDSGVTIGQRLCRLDIQDGMADWTTILEMENRQISSIVASEDELYIVGGCSLNQVPIQTVDQVVFEENASCRLEKVMDMGTWTSMNFQMTAKDGKIYAMYSGQYFLKIDLKNKTVSTDLPVPAGGANMNTTALASTPSGLILNASSNTGEKPADTWFFNATTETWQASDLVLDSALNFVISSVSTGNKVYVLGKSRNDNFWFFRALSFTESGMSADWHKGSGEDAALTIPVSSEYLIEDSITLDGKALTEGKDYEILPAAKDTEGNLDAEVLKAEDSGEAEQTTVVLKNAFLETLDLGRHDVVPAYNISGRDLAVTCTLNVLEAEKANAATGISGLDSGMTTAIALILLAAALGSVLILRRKRD